jgi:sodium transport system permease protein
MLASSQIGILIMQSQEEKVFDVAFNFTLDSRLEALIKEGFEDYKINIKNLEAEAAIEAFKNKEVMSYVSREKVNSKEVYKIYYNSSDADTATASNRIKDIIQDYSRMLTRDYIEKAGLDAEFIMEPVSYELIDVSADEEKTGMIFGMILPFILVVGIVTGAMYPAIDVTSGEKERGTLETLLTLPINNMELMGGKFLAVSTVAVVTAILNFISMILVGLFMINSLSSQVTNGEVIASVNLTPLILPFIITLICIVIFSFFVSAVVLCVTSFAKSFKEANNYMTPVILLFMLPAFIAIAPDVTLNTMTAAIPVVNVVLLIKEVLKFNYNAANMVIVLISSIAYTLIAVIALAKIYNSENILFGTGVELNFLEKRNNIIKGSKISPGDGLILYAVGLLVLFYLSSLFTLKLGFYGIAATQAVILAMPMLAALYLKADFKKTFKFRLPRVTDVIGGLIFWFGAFILANLAGNFLLYLFPQNEEVVSQLNAMLKGDNIWITLLVAALLPGICEELFFRGFIFSSLEGSVKSWNAVVLAGLMFALYHIDFIRIAPTFILGVAFTFALFKTGSILVPAIMHFANNAIAVFSLFYPEVFERFDQIIRITDNNGIRIVVYLLIAGLLIIIGYRILKRATSKHDYIAD